MTTLTDLTKAISRSKYRVQPAQLETLAKLHYQNEQGISELSGTYLRCLVAAIQATTGAGDGPEEIMGTLNTVHGEYMPHLEAGVVTPDIADNERLPQEERTRRIKEKHRRLTFARTSKADLRAYIASGGKLDDLDPAAVTRTQLREFTRAARAKTPGSAPDLMAHTKTGRQIEARVLASFSTALQQLEGLAAVKGEEIELTTNLLEELHQKLTELSDKLGRSFSESARVPRMPIRQGEKRGGLTLWPDQPAH